MPENKEPHWQQKEMEIIAKENPLVEKIVVELRKIDNMMGYEFDTMWERDLMKYRVIQKLLMPVKNHKLY